MQNKNNSQPLSGGGCIALRILCGLFCCVVCCLSACADASKEYQIKAAFLFNFTKFIEWPAAAFADDSAPIVIGVCGSNPFGAELHNIVEDRKINGREIVVKTVDTAAEAAKCHVLYFSAAANGSLAQMLPALEKTAVLTVGESERFTSAGGVINFVLEADKVRFEINSAAADKAGLKISAQLQKLARTVRRRP